LTTVVGGSVDECGSGLTKARAGVIGSLSFGEGRPATSNGGSSHKSQKEFHCQDRLRPEAIYFKGANKKALVTVVTVVTNGGFSTAAREVR